VFELEESKGEALNLEEGAKSHRGSVAPVGWRVRTMTVAFPRRQHAPVVDDDGGRHLQHRRGEGKTNWPKMDQRQRSPTRGGCDGGSSKSVVPGGGFLVVRWTNSKVGCEGSSVARSRGFFYGQGG
jgi:hypothetical protein